MDLMEAILDLTEAILGVSSRSFITLPCNPLSAVIVALVADLRALACQDHDLGTDSAPCRHGGP